MLGAGWTSDGWLSHGLTFSESLLVAYGAPGYTTEGTNASDRGVYGFPNFGISVSSSIVGCRARSSYDFVCGTHQSYLWDVCFCAPA